MRGLYSFNSDVVFLIPVCAKLLQFPADLEHQVEIEIKFSAWITEHQGSATQQH